MSSTSAPNTAANRKIQGQKAARHAQETLDPCVVLMKSMISQYAHLWEDKGGVYSLAQGVVWWSTPPEVKEALMSALEEDNNLLHTYCPDEGLPELKTALMEKLAEENSLSSHQLMVTAGANQAYMNVVLTLLDKEKKAVVFRPYYFNHVMAIQLVAGDDAVVSGTCSDDGVPDLAWLEDQLRSNDSIQLVTITNPGNPTGTSLSQEVLQRAVELTRRYGVWLVLDCTYEHFDHANGSETFDCSFPDSDHVIFIFSFSKGYAMAGYRCGYVVLHESQQDVFAQMKKVQDTIPICPSRISQVAAQGALRSGRGWVLKQVESLETGRRAILDAISCLETTMGGSGAMYVMGQLPQSVQDDQEVARRLVEEFGVAIIPGSYCGFPGWIRVCYSNLPPEQCLQAARRLSEGLQVITKPSSSI